MRRFTIPVHITSVWVLALMGVVLMTVTNTLFPGGIFVILALVVLYAVMYRIWQPIMEQYAEMLANLMEKRLADRRNK